MSAGHDVRWRAAIIKKVAPHVPVNAPTVQPSASVLAVLVDLNIAAAELLTRFLSMVSSEISGISSAFQDSITT